MESSSNTGVGELEQQQKPAARDAVMAFHSAGFAIGSARGMGDPL
jgi:hypothetical protein